MNRCICGVGERGVLAVFLIPATPVCFSKGKIESSIITRKPKPVAILQVLALFHCQDGSTLPILMLDPHGSSPPLNLDGKRSLFSNSQPGGSEPPR